MTREWIEISNTSDFRRSVLCTTYLRAIIENHRRMGWHIECPQLGINDVLLVSGDMPMSTAQDRAEEFLRDRIEKLADDLDQD